MLFPSDSSHLEPTLRKDKGWAEFQQASQAVKHFFQLPESRQKQLFQDRPYVHQLVHDATESARWLRKKKPSEMTPSERKAQEMNIEILNRGIQS